jgi:ribonuclease III
MSQAPEPKLEQQLEARLGFSFASRKLLQQALTHRSHSAPHNERLEFLGDSVLNCAVALILFERYSKLDEGDLSRLRSNLVKQQTLYEIAQRIELSGCLRLGEGELKSGGLRRPSILADTMEALFGAIFLDSGFNAAHEVIESLYQPILDIVDPRTLGKDAKTLLQENLQGRKIALPTYNVVATLGAAHNQVFEVECVIPKLSVRVTGKGSSRRAAEQSAAKAALEALPKESQRRARARKDAVAGEGEIAVLVATVAAVPASKAKSDTKPVEPKNADVKSVDTKNADAKAIDVKQAASAKVTPLPVAGNAEIATSAKLAEKPVDKSADKPVDKPATSASTSAPEPAEAQAA